MLYGSQLDKEALLGGELRSCGSGETKAGQENFTDYHGYRADQEYHSDREVADTFSNFISLQSSLTKLQCSGVQCDRDSYELEMSCSQDSYEPGRQAGSGYLGSYHRIRHLSGLSEPGQSGYYRAQVGTNQSRIDVEDTFLFRTFFRLGCLF